MGVLGPGKVPVAALIAAPYVPLCLPMQVKYACKIRLMSA
jgi:hypothetical protein